MAIPFSQYDIQGLDALVYEGTGKLEYRKY